MKRIFILLAILFGAATATRAQIVDFTSIDVQTESVKVIDVSTRPTGFVYGLGVGLHPIAFSRIDYTAVNFDLKPIFLCWQITPKFQWNVFDFNLGLGSAFVGDLATRFTYFFSPKIKSFYASLKLGYAIGDEKKVNKNSFMINGMTFGLGAGYAWKNIMLGVDFDMYNTEYYLSKEKRSEITPTLSLKAVFSFTL